MVSGGRVMVDTRFGLLTIASMTTDDSGEFLCIASNVVGRMTAERSVDVHSTPPLSRPSSLRRRHHLRRQGGPGCPDPPIAGQKRFILLT